MFVTKTAYYLRFLYDVILAFLLILIETSISLGGRTYIKVNDTVFRQTYPIKMY